MTCPACHGSGTVVKRFLFFFRRVVVCRVCGGTGQAPVERGGLGARRRRGVWRTTKHDDVVWSTDPSPSRDSPAQPGTAWVAEGGRSGGAGASASWGGNEPLIVDPFATDTAVAASSVASESTAATAASAGDTTSAGDSSSGSESSSGDSGTSY